MIWQSRKWASYTTHLLDCRGVLAEAAAKVGIEGAVEFLEDPNKGVKEVFIFYVSVNLPNPTH